MPDQMMLQGNGKAPGLLAQQHPVFTHSHDIMADMWDVKARLDALEAKVFPPAPDALPEEPALMTDPKDTRYVVHIKGGKSHA